MTEQPNMIDVEIVIVMDEDGNWLVERADDPDNISEHIGEMSGENGTHMVRKVSLTVRMRPPVAVEVSVEVPDEAGVSTSVEVQP